MARFQRVMHQHMLVEVLGKKGLRLGYFQHFVMLNGVLSYQTTPHAKKAYGMASRDHAWALKGMLAFVLNADSKVTQIHMRQKPKWRVPPIPDSPTSLE